MTDPKCDSVRPPTTIVAVLRVRTGQLRLGRQYKPALKRATEGRMRRQEPRRSTGDARSRKRSAPQSRMSGPNFLKPFK